MTVKLLAKKICPACSFVLAACLLSCASTQKSSPSPNVAAAPSAQNQIQNQEYPEGSDVSSQAEREAQLQKQGNPKLQKIAERNSASYTSRAFKDMFTLGGKAVYYEYDEARLFVKGISGGLKQVSSDVVINPKTQTAGLATSQVASFYYFLMNAKTRDFLREAAQAYSSDFEGKKLSRKDRSSYKKYGKSDVEIEWGMVKTSTKYAAKGKAYFGYEFEQKSPYFVITLFSRPNENVHESRNIEEEKTSSMTLRYYFTRSQLQGILEALSEDVIDAIMQEYNSYLYDAPQVDTYEENGGEYVEAE